MKIKKGVSVIVLSITILVMAILAATAIIALEDTGIIGRSKTTTARQNYNQEYTRLQVIKNGILTENFGEITVREYIDELKSKGIIENSEIENADSGEIIKTITATTKNVTGDITWTSSNPNVASVTGNNEVAAVTLKANGTATITATYGSAKATCNVTVNGTSATPTITLNKTTISKTITTGSTVTDTITATTQNISGALTWTSSNTSVATVSGSGNNATVTIKGAGTAIITATYGSTSASCSVVVTESVPTITLNQTILNATLTNGALQTATLRATTSNVSGSLTWTSSNTSVATVSGSGNSATVTMKSAGTATITAKYGSVSATCTVKVTESYTVSGTWTFNATITAPASEIRENMTFTSNGTTFSAMKVNTSLIYSTSLLSETASVSTGTEVEPEYGYGLFRISPTDPSYSNSPEEDIIPGEGFDGTAYSYGSWYNTAYRTIVVSGTQSVSKTFYNWLISNATQSYAGHSGGAL